MSVTIPFELWVMGADCDCTFKMHRLGSRRSLTGLLGNEPVECLKSFCGADPGEQEYAIGSDCFCPGGQGRAFAGFA